MHGSASAPAVQQVTAVASEESDEPDSPSELCGDTAFGSYG